MSGETCWSLVVPVKPLARAKSRLAELVGPHREQLALALAADTVAAAARCPRVTAVVVVTDDPVAGRELAALGAHVVADEPNRGLNPALRHGATMVRRLRPYCWIAALSADLPALRPDELARALEAAAAWPRSFVADAAGVGTTLYTAAPDVSFSPAFGPDSRARHVAAGVTELDVPEIRSVRRDVDTPGDLRDALSLGMGPRTSRIAALLGVTPSRSAGG